MGPTRALPPRDRQVHRSRGRQRGSSGRRTPPRAGDQSGPLDRAQVLRESRGRHRAAQGALVRLLREAGRHGNDPELFAGLVHACRYCGLYEESIAAHAEARRLDPNVPTSVDQTILMTGDIDRLLGIQLPSVVAGADDGIRVIGLGLAGRRDEARRRLADMRSATRIPVFQFWIDYLDAWLDRRPADMRGFRVAFTKLKIRDDPEAIFQEGWMMCDVGEYERDSVTSGEQSTRATT